MFTRWSGAVGVNGAWIRNGLIEGFPFARFRLSEPPTKPEQLPAAPYVARGGSSSEIKKRCSSRQGLSLANGDKICRSTIRNQSRK